MARDIFFKDQKVTFTHREKFSRLALFLEYSLLALVIVILVPAGVLIVSKDALPGDFIYPYKRQIENSALTLFSDTFLTIPLENLILGRRFSEAMALYSKSGVDNFAEFITTADTLSRKIVAIPEREKRVLSAFDLSNRLKGYKNTLVVARVKGELDRIILTLEEEGIKKN